MNRICFIGFSLAFVLSCAEFERINPCDSGGAKSDPQACAEAGSSSSSVTPSSSSVAAGSSSSSSATPSSSSLVPSSSSAAPSSSSTAASSSSVATSSSSVALSSSSSSIELCGGFVNGTEREHYGISKPQFCDSRDGKKYVYVTIGEQIWMAENLNYDANGSKCYGDNTGGDSQSKCDTYGRLYNWATAMNNSASSTANPSGIRGVCPAGWHLPSDAEWGALMQFVNPSCSLTANCANVSNLLNATSGWNNGNNTDAYGFSALPGGRYYGGFMETGSYSYWWSASEVNDHDAFYRSMNSGYAYRDRFAKYDLLSVRCLRD